MYKCVCLCVLARARVRVRACATVCNRRDLIGSSIQVDWQVGEAQAFCFSTGDNTPTSMPWFIASADDTHPFANTHLWLRAQLTRWSRGCISSVSEIAADDSASDTLSDPLTSPITMGKLNSPPQSLQSLPPGSFPICVLCC